MHQVACHFERRDCQHSELFQSEYKRTNRTKKTKILRCFPHCCPQHLNRSYCGSSLSVRVELTGSAARDAKSTTTVRISDLTSLLVFAHFEEAQTNFLSVDDEFDCNEMTSSLQTEQTPKGKWIEGTVKHDAASEQSCLFLINPGARWYYEWESAATKAQRFTKHVLRAYIFQQVSTSHLRVVGFVSSSEFMVVSYRRAPAEVRAQRDALKALRGAASAQQAVGAGGDGVHNTDGVPDIHHNSQTSSLRQITGREDDVWQDRKLWECRHPDIMVASKQLAILYCFVRFVDASPFGLCLEQWSLVFRQKAADCDSATKDVDNRMKSETPRSTELFSWAFLGRLRQASNSTDRFDDEDETENAERDPLSRLVHTCSSLVGWLMFNSINLDLYRRLLRSYSVALLDKSRVRSGYVEAIKLTLEIVDNFTGWNEDLSASSSSIASLSEDVMTVVFKYGDLKPLRRTLTGILSSNTMFGMHEFVAQLQAQFILQQRRVIPTRGAWKQANETSFFDGSWIFNGQQSSITPIRDSDGLRVSLGCLLEFLRELAQITIRTVNDQTLKVTSEWNVCSLAQYNDDNSSSTQSQSGMLMVLDSRPRVFGNFPSGLSSSIRLGSHSYGDYRGKVMSPTHFVLEMSSWPIDSSSTQPAFRWKFQIRVDGATDVLARDATSNPSILVMDVVVEEGFWSVDSNNKAPDFSAMSFSRKQQAVEEWYPTLKMKGVYNRNA